MAKVKFSELLTFLKKLLPDNNDIQTLEVEDDRPPVNQEPPQTPPPAKTEPGKQELKNENETLRAELSKMNTLLGELKKRDDDREAALSTKAKKEAEAKIQATIDEAIKTGRIPAKNDALVATYKKMLESDFDSANTVIQALPAIKSGGTTSTTIQVPSVAAGKTAAKTGNKILDAINETGNFVSN